MDQHDPKLREIWNQKTIPVVYRQGKSKPLLIRLPFSDHNHDWLKGTHRHNPKWNRQYTCWETPKSWFDDLIKRTLKKFGRVYVIQPYQAQQKCCPACWNAMGFECECSCMGANHGTGNPAGNWHVVSETFAVRWNAREYACRLIVASGGEQLA